MTREQRQRRKDYLREHRRYDFVNIWQRRYAHMKARHDGKATHFSHCEGKGLLTQQEFFDWCKQPEVMEIFLAIYYDWAMADFPTSLSPSIDRIDAKLGYVKGNLQWLTFNDNSLKNHWYIDPITKKKVQEVVPA